jgi:hypothetical protein
MRKVLVTLYIHTVFCKSSMRHRRPLTAAELADIWDRNPTDVVLTLLLEIHRLRATIGRADQIRRMIGNSGPAHVPTLVWECFENELNAEPCLSDPLTPRQQIRSDATVKRLEELRRNGRKG